MQKTILLFSSGSRFARGLRIRQNESSALSAGGWKLWTSPYPLARQYSDIQHARTS
jgi:hypothetical protein